MIISHKYKFLYVSIPKVASTSLHTYFNNLGDCETYWGVTKLRKELVQSNINLENYFKFTFVRNPWDRLVGCWNQKCHPRNLKNNQFPFFIPHRHIVFDAFVDVVNDELQKNKFPDAHIKPMTDILGGTKLDFVGKLENLQEDFNVVCDKIGIPCQKLPHKNKKGHKHYTEYYNEETKQIVAERYAKDIETFGYEFGE